MPEKSLFPEFEAASKAQWQEKAQKDLKGQSLDTLLHCMAEGYELEPYYTAEELPENAAQWQRFLAEQAPKTRFRELLDPQALEENPDKTIGYLQAGDVAEAHILPQPFAKNSTTEALEKAGIAVFSGDPQRKSAQGGYYPSAFWPQCIASEEAEPLQVTETLLNQSAQGYRVLGIETFLLHHAGSDDALELAYALAAAAAYFDALTEKGFSADHLAQNLHFSLVASPRFFPTIAKFRVFRLLLQQFLAAYQLQRSAQDIPLNARMSEKSWCEASPANNLLRATLAGMAATQGGADSLSIPPFREDFHYQQEGFQQRISRNILHILREESYFGKVADPAGGSYYLETLCQNLADRAWQLFLEMEDRGGLEAAFQAGTPQDRIEQLAEKDFEAFEQGEKIVVGLNRFREEGEVEFHRPENLFDEVKGRRYLKPFRWEACFRRKA